MRTRRWAKRLTAYEGPKIPMRRHSRSTVAALVVALVTATIVPSVSSAPEGEPKAELNQVQKRAHAYLMLKEVERTLTKRLKPLPIDDTPAAVMARGVALREAIEGYHAVPKLHPQYADAQFRLAEAYEFLGTKESHATAIKAYRKAIKIDPARTEIYHALAYLLVRLDQIDEARKIAHALTKIHEERGAACDLMIEDEIAYRKQK